MRFDTARRRRIPLAVGCALGLACASPGPTSETFRSAFGFEFALAPGWVLFRPQASEYSLLGNPNLAGVDPQFLRSVVAMLNAGDFEMLIRTPVDSPAQNIAIRSRELRLPTRLPTLLNVCEALPRELQGRFGRRLAPPAECRFRSVAGREAVYIEIEGTVVGTTNLQYQIQRSETLVIAITATALDVQLEEVGAEFETMIRSLRWTDTD